MTTLTEEQRKEFTCYLIERYELADGFRLETTLDAIDLAFSTWLAIPSYLKESERHCLEVALEGFLEAVRNHKYDEF